MQQKLQNLEEVLNLKTLVLYLLAEHEGFADQPLNLLLHTALLDPELLATGHTRQLPLHTTQHPHPIINLPQLLIRLLVGIIPKLVQMQHQRQIPTNLVTSELFLLFHYLGLRLVL